MSGAQVTEAHMEAASKLWDAAWRNIAREESAPVCVLAQAIADAEAAEREGIAKVLEGLAEHSLAATIRSRGSEATS